MAQRQVYGIGLNFGKQRNGYYSVSSDKKLLKESVTNILMTKPGERIHLPTYGVGMELYLFEQNDEVLEDVLRSRIIDQIAKWEPGVDVEKVEIRRDENTLYIRLTIRMKNQRGEITQIEYSIGG